MTGIITMEYCIIAASDELDSVKIEGLVEQKQPVCLVRWPEDRALLAEIPHWLVYLPDPLLRDCLDFAGESEGTLHLLAHPQARHSRRGFCLGTKSKLWSEMHLDRSVVALDLLRCNQTVVLNKVVAGRAFNYQPGGHAKNAWQRLKTVWHQFRHLRDYRPQIFKLCIEGNQQIETAAVGVSSTAHVLNSSLSRSILPENYANDGLFYSLVVAPRSLMQMLKHFVLASFSKSSRQPGFIGILRSRALILTSPEPFECHLDEQTFSAESITLEVQEKAIRLAVSDDSPLLNTGIRHKEIRRTRHLPSAQESIAALSKERLPWISHAATDEFKELYQTLRENAQVSSTFLVFMVLSVLLACFGLYSDSAPVIIGAMILAPLMAPIISLSMAFARQDGVLMQNSAKTLLTGLLMAIGFAMLFSILLPMQLETGEITARLRPTLLDLGIAMISGIAGAYAYARVDAAKSLAGVAIAVALVPPLAVSGIGLGWFDLRVALGALLLFLTNLAGIILAASSTFLLLGYAPFSRARKGIVMALTAVLLVSIPLAISFKQLAKEAAIVSVIEQMPMTSLELRSVQVISTHSPVQIRMEIVSSGIVDKAKVLLLKQQIAAALGSDVLLEVNWVTRF